MLCDKEGCGKRNYVDTMISNLPSGFIVGKLMISFGLLIGQQVLTKKCSSFEQCFLVLFIALQWENNETEKEILDTASVLATEIDISDIYRYEGDSAFTKYRLVSMVRGQLYNLFQFHSSFLCLAMLNIQVWSHGDLYNCVAYENNRWVRHFCSEMEVKLLDIFVKDKKVTWSVTE